MPFFTANGYDVLRDANISTNSSNGQDGAGQITIVSGTSIFASDAILEFEVDTVLANGEFTGSTGFIGLKVYASAADFAAGTPLYTYVPQNPGQTAAIQNSLDGIGDSYLRFNANVLVSSDPGAPQLGTLFVAPGSDVALGTPQTFDHHMDVDYDGDDAIASVSIEDGNGFFNIANATPVCFAAGTYILTPDGERRVESLRLGDLVTTMDNAPQRIEWISSRRYSPFEVASKRSLVPVVIKRGSFGAHRDLVVSQQHGVLASRDALVRAKILAELPVSGVGFVSHARHVHYVHLFFGAHQIVFANGVATESFYPGPHALSSMAPNLQTEFHRRFSTVSPQQARPFARRKRVKTMLAPDGRLCAPSWA